MTVEDIHTVANLARRAFAADGRALEKYADEAGESSWLKCVQREDGWALLKTEGARVVAACHGEPEWDFENKSQVPGVVHLSGLFVKPELWGQGIGRELLRSTVDLVHGRGFRKIRLWVTVDNARALPLYKSEDWRETGRTTLASDGKQLAEYEKELTGDDPNAC